MNIKLIVGLSNPGNKYAATRHNAGAWYVNTLAAYHQLSLKQTKKFYGYTGQLSLNGKKIYLLIPTTFMNVSGKAILLISSFYRIVPKEILVAHDELNLLPGLIRLKLGGSHGGHNGLKNIIHCLKNNCYFYRLRIGIGHPGDKNLVSNFVLSQPPCIELQLIRTIIDEAVRCTNLFISQDKLETAMNYLHSYKPMISN